MYAKGMTTRNIQSHIKDLYNYDISPEIVSSITDKVVERAREWQSRPLDPIYAVIYMDAVFLKMRTEGHVRSVAVYTIIGINLDGHKDCLGMWVCETESAKYWLSVLNECFVSEEFGQPVIFPKLWFAYNKTEQGDINEQQEINITRIDC
jgi:transposase-like protein